MGGKFIILDSGTAQSRPARPPSRDDYFTKRRTAMHGRLGYGGARPRLVGCEVLELTESGAHVEAYAPIDGNPQLFTLEINGEYQRARLCVAEGRRLRLEFLAEALDYIEAE